jgi:polysaccharide export outer membrane protein
MTNQPSSLLKALALAALVLHPLTGAAQGTRTAAPAPPRAAASPAPAPAARPTSTVGATRPWHEQEYRLGPGDKLRIEVYKQEQLSQSLQVRPDGKITLPLVGDVTASGQTPTELRDSLTTALKEYVTNPVVTVVVQEATSAQIHVIGEVEDPGTQVMQGPLNVLQALAQAGGLKEFADRGGIHVLRKTSTGTQNIAVNYKDALKGRTEPLYLQPGDTIVVP